MEIKCIENNITLMKFRIEAHLQIALDLFGDKISIAR